MEGQVYTVTVIEERIEWCNAQGKFHRLDGPALEWSNGTKEWYQKGKLHRLDGPALEWSNGGKAWYQNDQLHRLDGPALEWAKGDKEWWQNNQLHRVDGPARECVNGYKAWYLDGVELTEAQFLAKTQPKELSMDEIAAKFGIPVEQLKIKKS